MFIISKKGNRGAILHDYEFIDGRVSKIGVFPDQIRINGHTFAEYDSTIDYEDARNGLLNAIKDGVERYQLQ